MHNTLPKDNIMRWTTINLKNNTRESVKLTMQEVEDKRKLPSSSHMVYEIRDYPFLQVENHPLRWEDKRKLI